MADYVHEARIESVVDYQAVYIHYKGPIYLEEVDIDACYKHNVVEERTSDFDIDCEESIKL